MGRLATSINAQLFREFEQFTRLPKLAEQRAEMTTDFGFGWDSFEWRALKHSSIHETVLDRVLTSDE